PIGPIAGVAIANSRFILLVFSHCPLLPKRPADHFSRHPLSPALDLELRTYLGGSGGQIGSSDGYTERGTHRAAPDEVHFAFGVVNRITVTGEAAALELKADQLPGNASRLLGHECCIAGEGTTLVQLHDPAQSSFQRRGGIIDLIAVERVAHFQPQ